MEDTKAAVPVSNDFAQTGAGGAAFGQEATAGNAGVNSNTDDHAYAGAYGQQLAPAAYPAPAPAPYGTGALPQSYSPADIAALTRSNPELAGHMTIGQWIGTLILSGIPIVGFIMLLIWALGSDGKRSRKTWAQAQLVVTVFVAILAILISASSGFPLEDFGKMESVDATEHIGALRTLVRRNPWLSRPNDGLITSP